MPLVTNSQSLAIEYLLRVVFIVRKQRWIVWQIWVASFYKSCLAYCAELSLFFCGKAAGQIIRGHGFTAGDLSHCMCGNLNILTLLSNNKSV